MKRQAHAESRNLDHFMDATAGVPAVRRKRLERLMFVGHTPPRDETRSATRRKSSRPSCSAPR